MNCNSLGFPCTEFVLDTTTNQYIKCDDFSPELCLMPMGAQIPFYRQINFKNIYPIINETLNEFISNFSKSEEVQKLLAINYYNFNVTLEKAISVEFKVNECNDLMLIFSMNMPEPSVVASTKAMGKKTLQVPGYTENGLSPGAKPGKSPKSPTPGKPKTKARLFHISLHSKASKPLNNNGKKACSYFPIKQGDEAGEPSGPFHYKIDSLSWPMSNAYELKDDNRPFKKFIIEGVQFMPNYEPFNFVRSTEKWPEKILNIDALNHLHNILYNLFVDFWNRTVLPDPRIFRNPASASLSGVSSIPFQFIRIGRKRAPNRRSPYRRSPKTKRRSPKRKQKSPKRKITRI